MPATRARSYDAVVVGAGPNGFAAAIMMARNGLSTLLVDALPVAGGGMRTSELTLPGYLHDVCSAVHPLGSSSPFFRSLPLLQHGLQWIDSPAPVAHVFGDGSAVTLERSVEATAAQLGVDGPAYQRLLGPFVDQFERLLPMILAPLRLPADPLLMGRFGLSAVRSMEGLARSHFRGAQAPALLAGIAAHAMVPLDSLVTSSFALVLAMAGHAVGWPIARGGSQSIANALLAHYRSLGGELLLDCPIERLDQLPSARAYLLNLSPPQLLSIAGDRLPALYRRRVARYRYGPGVFKVDWAMSGPIPWHDPRCRRAVTVHLSGNLSEVAKSEAEVNAGRLGAQPFILLGQPSLVDDSRAPPGKHTVWAYCHVPHGSPVDALSAIEAQVERFAPGFRDLILARATRNAVELEAHSPNYIGGDISGGVSDLTQLFFRPVLRADPYATPNPQIFLCSSSTPPGGGVHGMCGYWAARSALHKVFGKHDRESSPRA
ncbi:MAG: phytoene dehydrogenase family FAD-dependent oxidoreductase [Myxococcaceae bacterium]|nr:phytoene dehydrogenase family FAD-dependent oxidoreductase [Myxococcaceae bacterium]